MARKATRKKASTRKTTTRKTTTKKTAAKKPAARKTASRKTTSRKTTSRKTTSPKKSTKKATKKTVTKKKAAVKKATKKTTKKTTPKKVVAKPVQVKKIRKASKPRNASTLSYTQSEFLENLRCFCGLPKKNDAKEVWNDISLFLQDSLKKGYRIPLVGIGKMYVRKSKARMGRNPATGETIHIPARKRVRFTVAKALKDTVL
ncbi:HU family DNA-binding protein [Oligoflexia bacterium]|nr:HU family DNA-binding protein [Oligoflexia bacterium]